MEETLKILSGLLTPMIGIVVGYIAWQQWKLNDRKFKSELFDRRFEIYNATAKFLANIVSIATTTNEELFTFLRETHKSNFLFEKDINKKLNEIYKKGVNLKYTNDKMNQVIEGRLKISETDYQKLCDQNQNIFTVLSDELSCLNKTFEKYLKIK